MPGTTTRHALPYPVGTDPINVAGDIKKLADAVDTKLGTLIASGYATSADLPLAAQGYYDLAQLQLAVVPFVTVVMATATVGCGNGSAAPNSWTCDLVRGTTGGTVAGHSGGIQCPPGTWLWRPLVWRGEIAANTANEGIKVRIQLLSNSNVSYGHGDLLVTQHVL